MPSMKGNFSYSIDAKGRVSLPAKYREALGNEVVVWNWFYDSCLYVQSQEEYEKISSQLEELSFADEDAALLRQALFANAFDVEQDKQGRILLQSGQREYAQLDKEVTIIGVGNHLEIWDRQAWLGRQARTQDHNAMRAAADNLRAKGVRI